MGQLVGQRSCPAWQSAAQPTSPAPLQRGGGGQWRSARDGRAVVPTGGEGGANKALAPLPPDRLYHHTVSLTRTLRHRSQPWHQQAASKGKTARHCSSLERLEGQVTHFLEKALSQPHCYNKP